MNPTNPQLPVASTGAPLLSEKIGFAKPSQVTLDELRTDPSTGNYTATKPGVGYVNTKAQLAEIRAGREDDAKRTASAKELMANYADEIAHMRRRKPKKQIRERKQ